MDQFTGQVIMFGGNFAPIGWAFCDGQLLAISENSALYSILGTTYGGDGVTTFALPDLRGRVVLQSGSGTGLTSKKLGDKGGFELTYLQGNQLPAHSHSIKVAKEANTADPNGNYVAGTGVAKFSNATDLKMNVSSTTNVGSGLPINNMQPYTCSNYIIALFGSYPSRN